MRAAPRILLCITLLSILASPALAQQGMGVGIMVGEPTGFSFKTWLHPSTAFAIGVAWSFENEDALNLTGDYLIHNYNTFSVGKGQLPFYYGLGARLKLEDEDSSVGIRVPVGLEYLFQNQSMDLFFEVVPTLDLAPRTELNVGASIGARYFFQ